jgi:hypothetical protein
MTQPSSEKQGSFYNKLVDSWKNASFVKREDRDELLSMLSLQNYYDGNNCPIFPEQS